MSGLLICAAVVAALLGALVLGGSGIAVQDGDRLPSHIMMWIGLALIAVALWLAYAAGAQP